MPLSNSRRRVATAIAGALLIALSSGGLAAPPAPSSTPTQAMRERMATLHEQMANCLRSDKSISECRAQMQKHCRAMMGDQGCTSMMGTGGMMGMGKGMHGPMTSSPPSSPPK